MHLQWLERVSKRTNEGTSERANKTVGRTDERTNGGVSKSTSERYNGKIMKTMCKIKYEWHKLLKETTNRLRKENIIAAWLLVKDDAKLCHECVCMFECRDDKFGSKECKNNRRLCYPNWMATRRARWIQQQKNVLHSKNEDDRINGGMNIEKIKLKRNSVLAL